MELFGHLQANGCLDEQSSKSYLDFRRLSQAFPWMGMGDECKTPMTSNMTLHRTLRSKVVPVSLEWLMSLPVSLMPGFLQQSLFYVPEPPSMMSGVQFSSNLHRGNRCVTVNNNIVTS